MLLITCAYGKVGRQIVPYLAKKGFAIRAIDMNPDIKKCQPPLNQFRGLRGQKPNHFLATISADRVCALTRRPV